MGGGFIELLGMLVSRASAFMASRTGIALTSGAAISDLLNLDWFRQQSISLAPGSDRQALDEVARLAYRLMNPAGGILWPRDRFTGQPIPPMFLVIDFTKGRGWFTSRNPARRRRFGYRRFGRSRFNRSLVQRRAHYA
jgi:hypothetical protein